MNAKLYSGTLQHARYTPRRHAFSYKVFMPFVELETVEELTTRLPLWSAKRWAPARFLRRDFLGPESVPLAQAVRDRIKEETGQAQSGPIYLLANWRYFGYQNNPIAVYYCYSAARDRLEYVVAEVTNTPWGESHSYVLTAPDNNAPLVIEFHKALHVSPFNPMAMTYRWFSNSPGDDLHIQIALFEQGERIFDAVLSLTAEPLDARSAPRAILAYPLMTIKVVAGIYWEALRLFLKGVSLHAHPKRSH
ncbi:MAG: DUF1365 domain-containing protein [Luminiphilus sp.]|nr:DUF1365 domain-containing protein [Luminiphilus sp.]